MKEYILLGILFSILALLFGMRAVADLKTVTIQKQEVVLSVSNPYSFNVDMEIKCDWTGKNYRMYKRMLFKKKQITYLKVPSNLKRCELWPHVELIGGR
jgi:hypothetical protein